MLFNVHFHVIQPLGCEMNFPNMNMYFPKVNMLKLSTSGHLAQKCCFLSTILMRIFNSKNQPHITFMITFEQIKIWKEKKSGNIALWKIIFKMRMDAELHGIFVLHFFFYVI